MRRRTALGNAGVFLGLAACSSGAMHADVAMLGDAARDEAAQDALAPRDGTADAIADGGATRPTGFAWDFDEHAVGASMASGQRVVDRSGAGLDGVTDGALAWVPGVLSRAVVA